MKKFLFALLAASVALFSACDEVEIPSTLVIPEESIAYFQNGIGFFATSDEGVLTVGLAFTATLDWSVSIVDLKDNKPATWLTVDPSSGTAGETRIIITAQDNRSEEPRSAKLTISCGGYSESINIVQAGLKSASGVTIELDPKSAELTIGQTLQLNATATSNDPVAPQIEWSSSNPRVATVTTGNDVAADGTYLPGGLVTGVSVGEAIISAKVGEVEATCKITVKQGGNGGNGDDKIEATSITLNKKELTLVTGLSEQLEIVSILPENVTERNALWESSNPNVAVVIPRDDVVDGISYKGGRVTGRDPGTAIIYAYLGSAKDSCIVTVTSGGSVSVESISIRPTPVTLAVDEEKLLTAIISPSDAKAYVTWTCDKQGIIALGSISETQAKIQGLAPGTATVTASAGGKTATCEVTVTGGTTTVAVTSITLNKPQLEMTVGQKETLVATVYPENATDKVLRWSVRDNRIVSVSENGELTAQSVGTTTVTVISVSYPSVMASCQVTVSAGGSGSGSSTLERVAVDPASATIAVGEEKALSLILTPSDAEVTIYWESSESSIAKVSMTSKTTAKVQGMSAGQATLTAHAGNLTATCDITVQSSGSAVPVESVTLNVHELQLTVNQQYQLIPTVLPENATEKGVVYSSTVSGSKLYIDTNGKITALAACEATITVRCKDNAYKYDTCHVIVTDGSGSGSGSGGDEAVDLGLPSGLKWRSMNVGASKPEDYGNYYAWAETSPKSSYTSSNYKYPATSYSDGITIYKKYDSTPGGDKKSVLEAEDDAATANISSDWRMPTSAEFKELRENCTWTWTTQNGVNGMLVTGPNKNSIFLPAGGWYSDSTLTGKTTYGSYWTATGDGGTAYAVDFINGDKDKALVPRCEGRSVRPVKD